VLTAIKQGLAKQCAVDTAVLSNLAGHIKLTRTLPLPSDVATGAATTDNAAVTTVNVTKVRSASTITMHCNSDTGVYAYFQQR
jgi:hypothetical protein